jgi:hypothetical protein
VDDAVLDPALQDEGVANVQRKTKITDYFKLIGALRPPWRVVKPQPPPQVQKPIADYLQDMNPLTHSAVRATLSGRSKTFHLVAYAGKGFAKLQDYTDVGIDSECDRLRRSASGNKFP